MMRSDIMEQASSIRTSMDAAAALLTDQQAARAPLLYPVWRVGETVAQGERRHYPGSGRLYKAAQGHTTQKGWEPDKTPALWTVIDAAHEGTEDDSIPAARGMEYIYGKCYTDPEDGKLYRCERTGEQAGGRITLQYLPHELVGQYFVAVN